MMELIIFILITSIYLFLKSKTSLHMLQQNWYNENNRYIKWMFKNFNKNFLNIDIIFVSFIFIMYLNSVVAAILLSIFYFVKLIIKKRILAREKVIKPLVYTKRIKRIQLIIYIIYFVPLINYYFNGNLWLYYTLVGGIIYINPIVVYVANILDKPLLFLETLYYKTKAKNKLRRMTNLKVVGITGSYGKTSSKNILNDILNVRFNSFATPKNFNTLKGLMISINNHLDKFNDVFIAEMGAFNRGSIKESSKFVKPKYGILTTIGIAHLESFKTQENIQKAKFELIEYLPNDGVAVLNGDDLLQKEYNLKNNCRIIWIGIENQDVDLYATNINLTSRGMTFDVTFKSDNKKLSFETRLLGRENVYNILAALALAKEFGLTDEQLIRGVSSIKPIPHRLELKKYGDIFLIDDAYNSNPVGASMALSVLKNMPGKRIIVTPGMVDLGIEQYRLNKELGVKISSAVDEVVIVGKENKEALEKGILEGKFDKKKIHFVESIDEAFMLFPKIKSKETFILLENDLPDLFK